jgi:hypothetical protein
MTIGRFHRYMCVCVCVCMGLYTWSDRRLYTLDNAREPGAIPEHDAVKQQENSLADCAVSTGIVL